MLFRYEVRGGVMGKGVWGSGKNSEVFISVWSIILIAQEVEDVGLGSVLRGC